VIASSRWLPNLADGPVGMIALSVVCGLCGAVVAIVGIEIYIIVREAERSSREFTIITTASALGVMLRDGGTVAGLALIAYLLAPKPQSETTPPAAEPAYTKQS
jgi:hypothetical protein